MPPAPETVLLRLEGPLQAWGDNSRLVLRRTREAPTKSGVMGVVCAALGVARDEAAAVLADLKTLAMGVRVDRAGARWWDYHTVGAGVGVLSAQGKVKITETTGEIEAVISRREYLCDASFLVALHGEAPLVETVAAALARPRWPVFLGRKCCPPSAPLLLGTRAGLSLSEALATVPWQPRYAGETAPETVPCLLEWRSSSAEPLAPADSEVWEDQPLSFQPRRHEPRLLVRTLVRPEVGPPTQQHLPPPPRPRADYQNTAYRRARKDRLQQDHHLCVFCKAEATTVQHLTYRRAGGSETRDDLRALCRLCHDAVTMIEYGLGMGLDRINPEDPRWREAIIARRQEIIQFRSLQTRRRHLAAEEVE